MLKPGNLVLFVLVLSISICGCAQVQDSTLGDTTVTPADSPSLPARGFFIGVLPMPAQSQEIGDSYQQAAQYAEFAPVWSSGIGSSGFWDYDEVLSGWGGDTFVNQLIRGNGMFPIIHFSFMNKDEETGLLILKTPDSMEDSTLSSSEWRELYKQSVLNAVSASKPLYLSVGNEVNRWYEQYGSSGENGFQNFISLYEEIYNAVKQLSPQTKVFCVFSREIVSENREADLSFLDLFDPSKLDILIFTTYPYSLQSINRPSDIPDDYYSRLMDYIPGKQFGFSEISWSSHSAFGGEQGQADFINEAIGRLTTEQGMELHLFGWSWLHDISDTDYTGMIMRNGTEKQAYSVWKSL